MLYNHLKIAFRSLLKFKGFAIINLLGLSLGLTTGMLIILFVADEVSYDVFHVRRDRIFRVDTQFINAEGGGTESRMDANGWPVGNILRKDYPEVEAVLYTRGASHLLITDGDKHARQLIHFASPEFFEMFTFPFVKGNAARALNEPYAVVITEDMEHKYFPEQDALGKSLTMADTLQLVVTGVMKNIPSNSHIQLDMVVSFATFEAIQPSFSYESGWGNINMRNYVLLKDGVDATAFAAKVKNIYSERAGAMLKSWGVSGFVLLEPLGEIYLHTTSGNGMGPTGSMSRVVLVSGIAAFVILLACINFINLTTARSVYRAREVGLRKVSGSSRIGIVRQFLAESLLVTLVAFVFSITLTGLLLPFFNELMGKSYQLTSFIQWTIGGGILVLVVLISLLSGAYPALVMSGFRPVEILKGKMQNTARGIQLRRSLVVIQFVISVGLAIGTLIVIDQLDFMQRQDLGFSKDQVFVVNAARAKTVSPNGHEAFKEEISALSFVDEVTFTNALPGTPGWRGQVAYPEGKSGEDAVSVEYMAVDAEYVSTLGLQVVAGRDFDPARETDSEDGLLLNEAAASLMGWASAQEAVGKRVESPSGFPAGEVIGVIKDYHVDGLQRRIGPIAMDINPGSSFLYGIRYSALNTSQLIESMEALWKKHFPGYDFNYFFLDESFGRQYQAEQRMARVFGLFAVVAIVIASIGLLGLVSFMVVSRTKEIGVRKVLGASVGNIVGLLSKEFVLLVVIANVIAGPLAWYFANEWLQGFAFRMSVDPLLFFWTMLVAVGFTLLTVSYQTYKAASTDPVTSLRYE